MTTNRRRKFFWYF